MRKIIVFIIFLLVAFVAGVKAQSTWNRPWPGATHTYSATVTDPDNNNPVRWYVTTDAAGKVRADTATAFKFVTPGYIEPDSDLVATAVYAVTIIWDYQVAANSNFYVFLEVDDNTTNCTNRMAVRVQIESVFNALIADLVPDPSCPGYVVNPVWNGSSQTDIGNSELIFRINKQNTVLNWQFEYGISEGTTQPFSIDSIRFEDDLSNDLAVTNQSGDFTGGVVGVSSTANLVLAYVYIRNQQGVTLEINFDLITANNRTRDADNKPDAFSIDNNADHTIQALPVITNFSGN